MKSPYSGEVGQCVEVARSQGMILIRDSKDQSGPVLRFTQDEWKAFAAGMRDGSFDWVLEVERDAEPVGV